MADNVKVAVRVRPFNQREKDRKSTCCIKMEGKQTIITNPADKKTKNFTFDFSYNSFVPRDHEDYASQETVWRDIGLGVLSNAYEGYNCSLFAYGQTGAGKSYSMMGYGPDRGIIPIASEKIFDRINANTDDSLTIKVQASMLEIYMEKIRDLFEPKMGDLKIRNNPKKGFYVESLSRNAVGNHEQIEKLMESGSKARTVASTNMNATSSRAHTIFQIILTQTKVNKEVGKATDKVAIINLIDLAGSERQSGTGATGARLKEGSAINLSLSSLGNCIHALAEQSNQEGKKKKKVRVPYRDSVLTMLLQNSLGGNAKTIMIAAISPADINYDETLSTLRYANRAKQIKNKAVVNEDPNEKVIRGLREEIEQLRAALANGGVDLAAIGGGGGGGGGVDMSSMLDKEREEMKAKMEREKEEEMARIREELQAKMMQELEESKTWEQRVKETEERAAEREKELASLGVMTGSKREEQKEMATRIPHIVNLHEDPLLSEQVMYFIKPDKDTTVGRKDAEEKQSIMLGGLSIAKHHAVFRNVDGRIILSLATEGAKTHLNGEQVAGEVQLHHCDRIIFGNNHVFKAIVPAEKDAYEAAQAPDAPPVDYNMATMEINKAQVAAMAAKEEERRREAEELKRQAEERVAQLEQAMQEERAKMEREMKEREAEIAESATAKSEVSRVQEEMRKKQEELELKLKEQIEETNRMTRKKERENRERSLLDEKLLKTIPLVAEANAISDELGRRMAFGVKLMAKQHTAVEAKVVEEEEDTPEVESLNTEVYIRVEWTESKDPPIMWMYEKFMDRLYLMREMYQSFCDAGREVVQASTYGLDVDPFEDENPGPQLIGKALIYLDPLIYVMDISDPPPIIDYKGHPEGELVLRIVPHLTEEPPEDPDAEEDIAEELQQLRGKKLGITVFVDAARGLPPTRSADVFVQYRFFLDDTVATPMCATKTINPRFDYKHTFRQVVTDEFIKYVSENTLEFEVYGAAKQSGEATYVPQPHRLGGGGGGGGGGIAMIDNGVEMSREELDKMREALRTAEADKEKENAAMEARLEAQRKENEALKAALEAAEKARSAAPAAPAHDTGAVEPIIKERVVEKVVEDPEAKARLAEVEAGLEKARQEKDAQAEAARNLEESNRKKEEEMQRLKAELRAAQAFGDKNKSKGCVLV